MHLFLPGADGHLVWVMDVGATVATVTLAKAVVVHAVLLRRLLLMSVPDYGEASLDCTACFRHAEKKHRYQQINSKQPVVTREDNMYMFQLSTL